MKAYLGDSVYAECQDGRTVTLTTENGLEPSNTIVLEPEIMESLRRFYASAIGQSEQETK